MKTSAARERLPFEVEDTLIALSRRVSVVRRARGLTQPDLAAKAGVSLSTIVAIEKGASTVQIGYWFTVLWALDLTEGLAEQLSHIGKGHGDIALLESQLPKRVRGSAAR